MSLKISFALLLLGVASLQGADAFRVLALGYLEGDPAHVSYVGDCNRWFPSVSWEHGFTYEFSTDWWKLNDNDLRNYDVVMFLNGQPWDWAQREALQRFIESGGGFISYHVSSWTDQAHSWDWYYNTLLGSGNFYGNTWRPTSAVLRNEGGSHPATARLPEKFSTQPNEWYSWHNDLRQNSNIQILLSIHEDSFPLGTGPNPWEIWYSGYYPVVWTNRNYNMLYVNMGHNDMYYEGDGRELSHTFDNEVQNRLIIDGLKWLGNRRATFKVSADNGPLLKTFHQ